jgi:nickel-dependent lactate racemase
MATATMTVEFDLGRWKVPVEAPAWADVLTMRKVEPLAYPAVAVRAALADPMGCPPLGAVAAAKIAANPEAKAVVVISDNTRPVPYRGDSGIVWPVVSALLEHGFRAEHVTVLVATGTHRAMTGHELAQMVDPQVIAAGVRLANHDCRDRSSLRYVGTTRRGTRLEVNTTYLDADLKILTGLVESHFMAGASGGRKAIVPGLIGEDSTFIFHGAEMLAAPGVADLVLEGNPCHEEALEGALLAGADFIVNVTLDRTFRLTGVFAGELQAAHRAAVDTLRSYAGIPVDRFYDVAVVHAGRVGINHYQAAKAGVVGASALRPGGKLVIAAHHTDVDPIGSARYRTLLHLLKLFGPERYERLIMAPEWRFVPDQWEPQMWGKVLAKVDPRDLYYCGTGLEAADYEIIPGFDGHTLLPEAERYGKEPAELGTMTGAAVREAVRRHHEREGRRPRVAVLADGPYGIPVVR